MSEHKVICPADTDLERLAAWLHENSRDLEHMVEGYEWPLHETDDGYRGDGSYVRLIPKDVLAHHRDFASALLRFLAGNPPPQKEKGAVMPISKKTALEIAYAYREVETAEELLKQIVDELGRARNPDIRDAFGERQTGLQLGVPSSHNSHRLFNVPWAVCKPIIELHIAEQRSKIALLTEQARAEMAGEAVPAPAEGGAA